MEAASTRCSSFRGSAMMAVPSAVRGKSSKRHFSTLILPDAYCSVLIMCSFSVVRSRPGANISSANCLLECLRVLPCLS